MESGVFDSVCTESATNAFQAAKTTTAGAEIAWATQRILEGASAAPETEHYARQHDEKESNEYDDQVIFSIHKGPRAIPCRPLHKLFAETIIPEQ